MNDAVFKDKAVDLPKVVTTYTLMHLTIIIPYRNTCIIIELSNLYGSLRSLGRSVTSPVGGGTSVALELEPGHVTRLFGHKHGFLMQTRRECHLFKTRQRLFGDSPDALAGNAQAAIYDLENFGSSL